MNMGLKRAKTLKLIKVGNSVGVILPKQVLEKLGVELGDQLDLIEGVGGLQLQRHDEGFAAQMEVAREVMKRRRNALRELAK
jgi:putative addiction module antidote